MSRPSGNLSFGLLVAAVFLFLMAAGCGGDRSGAIGTAPSDPSAAGSPFQGDRPSTPDLALSQVAAESLFAGLHRAYNGRDLEAYTALFADDFTFVFTPEDVNNPIHPTPPQWGLADELAAHDHLFHGPLVDHIVLTFQIDRPVPSSDEYPGTWKVNMTEVELRVYTHTEDGTPWEFRVRDVSGTFYLKPVPSRQPDQAAVWRIWRWEDHMPTLSRAGLRVRQSWGWIKYLYR